MDKEGKQVMLGSPLDVCLGSRKRLQADRGTLRPLSSSCCSLQSGVPVPADNVPARHRTVDCTRVRQGPAAPGL